MNRLSKAEIQGVLRRHERGLRRAEIIAETGLSRSQVYAILTGAGLTKAPAATRKKYSAIVERMLEAGAANGSAPRPQPKKAKAKPRRKAKAAS